MNKNLSLTVARLSALKGAQSVSAFASKCAIAQPMMDRYLKGENTPSGEKIIQICIKNSCSADWLLGLSDVRSPSESCSGDTNSSYENGMKKQVRFFKQKAEKAVEQATAFLKTVEEIERGL